MAFKPRIMFACYHLQDRTLGRVLCMGYFKTPNFALTTFEPKLSPSIIIHQLLKMFDEVFDPHGDLTLLVGSDTPNDHVLRYRVSTHVLCLASPVWEAMLTGNFREGLAKNIPFPEDDASALRILLLIAHRLDKVSTKPMSVDALANIADLCDKYDTVDLVRQYTDHWVKDCRFPNLLEPVAHPEQLLWVY
jgi:hypothetical protein